MAALQFTDRAPIYRQIADDLRRQILVGVLAEGDRVMSTNEYAAAFRINPATAAKAFAELVADGLLERRRGIGMFVATGARERLTASGRERYARETLLPAIRAGVALGLGEQQLLALVAQAVRAVGDASDSSGR